MELQVAGLIPDALYKFCLDKPGGVTQADLASVGWTDPGLILSAANQLLSKGLLCLSQLAPGQLLDQAVDPGTASKFRGLEREHLLVYQMIEKTGSKGAWSKVLKDQTNLQQHTLAKLTKELLRRNLIKEVKSVAHRGRKVFMLSEIEPDKSVSGGAWYHDGEFAAAWISSLREMARSYLENNMSKVKTLQELHTYIQQQPGPSPPMEEDVQAIMRTLELDVIVYSVQSETGQMIYVPQQRPMNGESFDLFQGRLPSWAVPVREESPPARPCGALPPLPLPRPVPPGRADLPGEVRVHRRVGAIARRRRRSRGRRCLGLGPEQYQRLVARPRRGQKQKKRFLYTHTRASSGPRLLECGPGVACVTP